jgi:hypothetical protein
MEVSKMFRENTSHRQTSFFDSTDTMDPRVKARLDKSWAPIFYEHIFCKIDEKPFAILYSDIGAPNFPVNIALSLELIKHLFNYSDDELMDQFYFNYQINYAVGIRHLGGLNLAERTFYDFRARVYRHATRHPEQEDLVFGEFLNLTNNFLKTANIGDKAQRMDSTMFMPNIKKAGRLALAYDVLIKAVKAIPENELPEELKAVLKPNFKIETLYKSKPSESDSKMDQLLNLCLEAERLLESHMIGKAETEALRIVKRFIKEQANFDKNTKQLKAKSNKEISPDSLQSAYEEDCTFRTKGDKSQSGYLANLAETCAKENPIQLITDYTVAPNIKADVTFGEERIPIIKETTDCNSMTLDGGYYSEKVTTTAAANGIDPHFTDMTGRGPGSKLLVTAFEFEAGTQIITKCPNNVVPLHAAIKGGQTVAHFPLEECRNCPLSKQCHVKVQKKDCVIRIDKKSIETAKQRTKIENERRQNTSDRAAIEGTNSALKRAHGMGKLRVRGQAKCTVVVGYKVIAHNFKMFARFMIEQIKNSPIQGELMPITCY